MDSNIIHKCPYRLFTIRRIKIALIILISVVNQIQPGFSDGHMIINQFNILQITFDNPHKYRKSPLGILKSPEIVHWLSSIVNPV